MESLKDTKVKKSEYLLSKKYPIAYYDMDLKEVLKPSALMNFLQDTATINAEMHGFGYSFTYPKNYGWFLIKYRMEFDDYPEKLDDVIIKTEPRGIAKILAFRDFEIWTPDDKKRLGRVASNWMMIDFSNKSILPIGKMNLMGDVEKRETDLQFEKITPPETITHEKEFEIRYDDIDVNQHVNNANYIVWAFETLPYEFKTEHKIKTLDIVYKKEIQFGHKIISQAQLDESSKSSTHILKNATTKEDLCLIKVNWI